MFKLLRKLVKDPKGNALVIAAAALPLLIGSAGLATDTIQWALWKRQLQRAADSAAIAGAYQKSADNANTNVPTAIDHDLTLNQHTGIALQSGYPQITYPADTSTIKDQVKVVLAVRRPLSFSGLFMTNPPLIRTSATAASVQGTTEFCMAALESSGSVTGINVTGNAAIEMDCSMMSNSPSPNSAVAKGSATVKIKSVAAVGGIQQSNNWTVDSYQPYTSPLTDPFANINPLPSEMKCAKQGGSPVALDENTNVASANDGQGNAANCFTSLSVGANKTLTLPAGTYYLNGGGMDVKGTLNCTGCTIIMTNTSTATNATIGDIRANAGANMNINAPTTGKYAGIAIYQDRRATNTSNKINGHSASIINGAIYFPNSTIDYNGTGTTTAVCTMFVGKNLSFSGNSSTSNKFKKGSECGAFGLPTITGGKRVRLVA